MASLMIQVECSVHDWGSIMVRVSVRVRFRFRVRVTVRVTVMVTVMVMVRVMIMWKSWIEALILTVGCYIIMLGVIILLTWGISCLNM